MRSLFRTAVGPIRIGHETVSTEIWFKLQNSDAARGLVLSVFGVDLWTVMGRPVHGDQPLFPVSAKWIRLVGGGCPAGSAGASSSFISVGGTAVRGQRVADRSVEAPPPAVTRLLYRAAACPLHAAIPVVSPLNALPPPVSTTPPPPPLPVRFNPTPGPHTLSAGIGDLGSCLMSVDAASR